MLSAGIDSSSIAATVKKKFNQDIKYFSYKPNYKDYDESELIKQNIQSLDASNNHTFVNFEGGDSIQILREIITEAALPFNAPSDWLFHILCDKMKEQNCTTFFTGCAGDDIFSGNYIDHLNYLVSVHNDKAKFDKALFKLDQKYKTSCKITTFERF